MRGIIVRGNSGRTFVPLKSILSVTDAGGSAIILLAPGCYIGTHETFDEVGELITQAATRR